MPRRLPPAFALSVALFAVSALAGSEPVRAPTFSATLEGGASLRQTVFQGGADQAVPTGISGPSLLLPRLRAEGWFLRALGVEGELFGDFFTTKGPTGVLKDLSAAGLVRAGVAARFLSSGGFLLQGSLGYGAWFAPIIRAAASVDSVAYKPEALVLHGPVARLGLGYAGERFEGLASLAFHLSIGNRVNQAIGGVWLGARVLDLDAIALWGGLTGEAMSEFGAASYSGITLRLALGLKLSLRPPRPAAQLLESVDAAGTELVFEAALPDGRPAVGALISLDGAAGVAADAQGVVRAPVKAGAHEVKAVLAGHRTAAATVQAPEGKVTRVALRLEALSGPGTLAGVVRAAATGKPVPDASVTVGESAPVQTGADGSYRLEKVGPGPVQVRIEAQGFNLAEEVVQVPPEAAATLDVSLEPLGKGSPATVRGLVRSRSGEALKASVVIKGSAVKVQVSPEGRFFVTVPGGTYVFVISAPGYVTQTKKVVLADGDQAILHTELQKVAQ